MVSRKVPHGAKPASRRTTGGRKVEGYLKGGTFVPFEAGNYDYAGPAAADSSVSCSYESSSDSGSTGSYDSGSADCGGGW